MKYLEAKRLAGEGENKALGGPGENKGGSAAQRRGVSRVTPAVEREPDGPTASPQAKQLAKEHGIDLATVTGTGGGGVITAGDVRKVMESKAREGGDGQQG